MGLVKAVGLQGGWPCHTPPPDGDIKTVMDTLLYRRGGSSERLDNDPSGARYGCFLPDLAGLARRLPAPTSQPIR